MRSKSGFRSAKAAADHRAEMLDGLRNGTYVSPDMTRRPWQQVSEEWLEARSEKLKPRTVSSYRRILGKWLAPWKAKPIGSIERGDVRRVMKQMRDAGLAPQTRHNVFNLMHAVFTFAEKEHLIAVAPTRHLREELPKREESEGFEPRFLTPDEVDRIAGFLNERFGLMVRFTVWTGLRAAEVAGLKVKRLETLRHQVHVVETAQWKGGGWIIDDPKSKNSRRTVPVPPALMRELTNFVAASNLGPEDYVFGGHEPNRHPAFYLGPWRRATKAAGFPGLRFHDLRHSFAALMDSLGYPLHRVSKWLGHSSSSFTVDRYMKHGLFVHEEEEHLARLDAAYASARASAPTVVALATGTD